MAPSMQMHTPHHRRRTLSSPPARKNKKPDHVVFDMEAEVNVKQEQVEEPSEEQQPPVKRMRGRPRKVHKGRPKNSTKRVQIRLGDDNIAASEYDDSEREEPYLSCDEESQPGPSNATPRRKNKALVYKSVPGGRAPAPELFRMDLLQKLRENAEEGDDSDDEEGPFQKVVRISDRWRPEWNCGVQIVVNPDDLSSIVVEPRDLPVYGGIGSFQLPQKYISTSDFDRFSTETHVAMPYAHRLLYPGDLLDELWLHKCNSQRAHLGHPGITMLMFLRIMQELEVQCYKNIHEKLLAPLNSPAVLETSYSVDEEAACDICRSTDGELDDAMVFCDGCNICVHMSCYGLIDLPPDEWLCMKCKELGVGKNPACIMCPTIGGAMKQTEKMPDGEVKWTHVACALWIPECRFGDIEKREPVTKLDLIPQERWNMKCSICDTRQGACITCVVPSCKAPFHVSCALRRGLEMRIEQDPLDPSSDLVRFVSLCDKHRTTSATGSPRKHVPSPIKTQLASDEEHEEGSNQNPELKRLLQFFFLHVDQLEIRKAIGVDELAVSMIFEYWKQRRIDNNNHPLIPNLEELVVLDPTVVLDLPGPDDKRMEQLLADAACVIKKSDRARKRAELEVKRQQALRKKFEIERRMIDNMFNILIGPIPQGQRHVRQLEETLLNILTPEEQRHVADHLEEEGHSMLGQCNSTADSSMTASRSGSVEPRQIVRGARGRRALSVVPVVTPAILEQALKRTSPSQVGLREKLTKLVLLAEKDDDPKTAKRIMLKIRKRTSLPNPFSSKGARHSPRKLHDEDSRRLRSGTNFSPTRGSAMRVLNGSQMIGR